MVKGRSALLAWTPRGPMEADRAEGRHLKPIGKADRIACAVAPPIEHRDVGR